MKIFLRRLFLFLGAIIILLLAASIIGTWLFGNRIGQQIVSLVNNQITTELSVNRFQLSLIRNFPNVNANLRGVTIKDAKGGNLIAADNLSCTLSLWGLINGDYDIKTVELENGEINLFTDANGSVNYDIAAETSSTNPDAPTQTINLSQAILNNIVVQYQDQQQEQSFKTTIENGKLSGAFSNTNFTLHSDLELILNQIQTGQQAFLKEQPASLSGDILVDLNQSSYQLDGLQLTLAENTFDMRGLIETRAEETYIDIDLRNNKGSLAALSNLLPLENLTGLKDLQSAGDFLVTAQIKGVSSATRQPAMNASIELRKGRLQSSDLKQDFRDVTFVASFTNGRRQNLETSNFKIEQLAGYFNEKRTEVRLTYENFEAPEIDVYLDGVIPVSAIYGFLDNPMISEASGELVLEELQVLGRLDDLQNPSRLARIESSGSLSFNNAQLSINQEPVSLPKGKLSLEDQLLTIEELKFEGAGTNLQFDGSAYNVIPVIFADEVNSRSAELEFSATLRAASIDFDRLMNLTIVPPKGYSYNTPTSSESQQAVIKQREKITNYLKGRFNAVIDTINYNNVYANDFAGVVDFNNSEMLVKGEMKTMDGSVEVDGQVFFEAAPRMKAKFIAANIQTDTLFSQLDNFGQTVLTDENISGKLNSNMVINAFWNEQGVFQEDKLRIIAGVGITDGQLVDFEMLRQFSNFVKIEDLMNIKFSNLENYFEYRRQKLFIPVMFIQSNALNLTINGEHSDDNRIKYNLKVNAGQVLTNKLKRHDPDLKPLKARKEGFFNLYYTIFGDLENYEIESAKRRIKQDFELSNLRRRELRIALEEEFGYVKLVEEPVSWRDIPQYDEEALDPDKEEFLDFEITEKQDTTKKN